MALIVTSPNPANLLVSIKKAINANHVQTWEVDSDGDFTHSPPQWRTKAYLRPVISNGTLTFNILRTTTAPVSSEVYAIYHGRFAEMLLAHFDENFVAANATAMPTAGDKVA